MSDGSTISRIYPEPHQSVGAQDLLTIGRSHCGFMRKKGQLERTRDSFKLFGILFGYKWRQRFVILAGGCMYIYSDEFAKNTLHSTSLRGYSLLQRLIGAPKNMRWCFQLIPLQPETMKTYTFSCANEEERKEWMKQMKSEMMIANNVNHDSVSSEDQDDYCYLETALRNVKCPVPERKEGKDLRAKLPAIPPSEPKKNQSESGSGYMNELDDEAKDDYDEINDLAISKGKPPKPLPKPEKKNQLPPKEKANAKAKAKAKVRTLSRQDYEYKGMDRGEVERLLNDRSKGTFLVRKSRADEMEVLSVNTDEGMKEYKIFKDKDGHVSIDKVTCFPTTDELVEHYRTNVLPRRTLTLSNAYSTPDVRM